MNGRLLLSALGALALLVPHAMLAQEVKPGPEHALFKEWEGQWDAAIKSMGGESKGSVTSKAMLGGLWYIEEFKADLGGMTFEGRGATSYDPAKKKYVGVWIDSMSTSPLISEGAYDKATKTLTMTGSMSMPDGSTMKVVQTTVFKDANTKTFSLKGALPDGNTIEMIGITYTRKK